MTKAGQGHAPCGAVGFPSGFAMFSGLEISCPFVSFVIARLLPCPFPAPFNAAKEIGEPSQDLPFARLLPSIRLCALFAGF